MAKVFALRKEAVEIVGVFDAANNRDAAIDPRPLGEAIQFVANASVLGYDVRSAMIFYGTPGTPSLRTNDCERLWDKYGMSLVRSDRMG